MRTLGLESSTLPLSHCAPYNKKIVHYSYRVNLLKVIFCNIWFVVTLTPHPTGRRSRYAHGDLEFSLKLFQIAAEAWTATRFRDLTLPVRFQYASTTLPLCCCYDPTTTMKIWLRLVYADSDVAATLLRPWLWSYAFVALLYPYHAYYIESEITIRFYYDQGASTALLLSLAVSATIRVILTKISNRSGIAVQWNGGWGGGIRIFLLLYFKFSLIILFPFQNL